MKFIEFANYLVKIESTSSRLDMTSIVGELLTKLEINSIDKAIYLLLGNLGPTYNRVEFNISDKTMIKILSLAMGLTGKEIEAGFRMYGDYGDYAASVPSDNTSSELTVEEIFDLLQKLAAEAGNGSQERRINAMSKLIKEAPMLSRKYLVRIPLGKLRLGFSDMTLLDALSWMISGDKSHRKELERSYNESADIGLIARIVKEKGVDGLANVVITPGIPVRPAAAERLPTAQDIIDKLGEIMTEPKIDGFRVQCHFKKGGLPISPSIEEDKGLFAETSQVRIYSRNLENMSNMFPELTDAVSGLDVDEIIFEGEAVAYQPETGAFLPFQETIQRRRKHNIDEKSQEIPLRLFAFDLLFLNGESWIDKPFNKRREMLSRVVGNLSPVLSITRGVVLNSGKELKLFFEEQIELGLEGIMAKRLDAPYSAGARSYNWVKLKREERGELVDSIDCVVMGYKMGEGKRSSFGIGAFLVGIYDEDVDMYRTVSNIGTGLTDVQWVEMKKRADQLLVKTIPSNYDVPKQLQQDVWVTPNLVVEILADEITISPMHTAGYALRFPRLVGWRDDKSPDQATSLYEFRNMFTQQKKR